jgi:hypothetical protein
MHYAIAAANSHHVLRNLLIDASLAVTLTLVISVFIPKLELTTCLLPHTRLLARAPQDHTFSETWRDRLAGVEVVMPDLKAGFRGALVLTSYLVAEPALGVVDRAALAVVGRGERLCLASPQERANLA